MALEDLSNLGRSSLKLMKVMLVSEKRSWYKEKEQHKAFIGLAEVAYVRFMATIFDLLRGKTTFSLVSLDM